MKEKLVKVSTWGHFLHVVSGPVSVHSMLCVCLCMHV